MTSSIPDQFKYLLYRATGRLYRHPPTVGFRDVSLPSYRYWQDWSASLCILFFQSILGKVFYLHTPHSYLRFRFPEFVLHSSSFSAKPHHTNHQNHPSIEQSRAEANWINPSSRRVSETGRHDGMYSEKQCFVELVPTGCLFRFRVSHFDAMWLVTLFTRHLQWTI